MMVRCVLIQVANPSGWVGRRPPANAPAGLRRGRAHRVFARGRFCYIGSGHYPLCRGYNRPPETLAPCRGPGVPDASRQGSRCWGWMDLAVGGAVGPYPSDSPRGLQARLAQRSLPSTCRPVILPELLPFRGCLEIKCVSVFRGVSYISGGDRSSHRRA